MNFKFRVPFQYHTVETRQEEWRPHAETHRRVEGLGSPVRTERGCEKEVGAIWVEPVPRRDSAG